MSNFFVCCDKCIEEIGKRSTSAARIWMDLCSLRMSKGEYIQVKTVDFPELRSLENMGYVCTTESPPFIIVRVHGHIVTDDGQDFFCIKGGDHE